MADQDYMTRALDLAERGRGRVEPNPLVGAVVVRDGLIVGEGWHEIYGQAHAEVNALRQAGEAARGATLFVTLEPCCHFGKTPPCTTSVLAAGIRRVVCAMLDPFPQVSGQGASRLREAGIAVEVGLGEGQARRMNAPYLKRLRIGLPWVHAKWAMSADGKIATRTGNSKWITGEAARARVHELRGRMDAIIVGKGTLLADDPLLTARPPGPRTPVRIVLTATADGMPGSCQLLETMDQAPVLVATDASQVERLAGWRSRGAEILGLPLDPAGGLSVPALLATLGQRGMTNVLVEGGWETLGRFFDREAVDEVHVYVAPKVIGGAAAPTAVGGVGKADVSLATKVSDWAVEVVGSDVLLHGRVTSGEDFSDRV